MYNQNMAQTLDANGNVVVDGYATNLSKNEFAKVQPSFDASKLGKVAPINVPAPSTVDPSVYSSAAANAASMIQAQNEAISAQQEQDLQLATANNQASDIAALQRQLGGVEAERASAYQTGGVNESFRQLKDILAQSTGLRNEAAAIPLLEQNKTTGQNITSAAVQRNATDRLRENAIKQLGLGQQAAIAQANYDVAKNLADQQIDLKYAQIDADLKSRQTQLAALEKYKLTPAQEKLKQARQSLLAKEEAEQKERKETEKSINEIGLTLRKYGVDSKVVAQVLGASSVKEAMLKAGNNLQDPKAKLELQSLGADIAFRNMQIAKERKQLEILNKYGGLSPSEYRAQLKEEQKRIAAEKDAKTAANLQADSLDEKTVILDSVLNSRAIDSVVGPSFLARRARGVGDIAARALIPGIGLGVAAQGAVDYFTGSADKLVGNVEQLISKEFIDNLKEAKAAGATFGALTKAEQDALTAAATFIGSRRVYSGEGEDKEVVGYDMSEADFKAEMQRIQEAAKKASLSLRPVSPDEEIILGDLFPEELDPPAANYYNN